MNLLNSTRLIAGLRPAFCSPNGLLMSREWGNLEGKLEWKVVVEKLLQKNWSGWKNWEGEIEAGKSDQENRSRKTGSGKPEWQNQSEITVAEKSEWEI